MNKVSLFHFQFHRLLRTAVLLVVPYAVLLLNVAILFALYGGHRNAILGNNPFCNIPVTSQSTSSPPRVILQISDLHVDNHVDSTAKRHLTTFSSQVLPRWSPLADALIVTGDLVHAMKKRPYPLGSRSEQQPAEWAWTNEYAAEINRSLLWLPVHGNHDSFGGHPNRSSLSGFSNLTSGTNPRVTSQHLRGLSLLGVNGTLEHPLHRPFNFFGNATGVGDEMGNAMRGKEGHDALAFAHYPSSIMSNGGEIHHAAGRSTHSLQKPNIAAFLSGHLHTLHGWQNEGLQSVAKSGAFELQIPDMVSAGVYRVLVFDNSFLSFKDFNLLSNSKENVLDDIIITNPPQAGFCSAGAGSVALESTHVRFLSPRTNLDKLWLEVHIDGQSLGPVEKLSTFCKADDDVQLNTCENMYSVAWDASQYKEGVHRLEITSYMNQSRVHLFSIDGSPRPEFRIKLIRLISALFSLSDFEKMLSLLCTIGFVLSFILAGTGALHNRVTSITLLIITTQLYFGPILMAPNLISSSEDWGWVALGYTQLPFVRYNTGADAPYLVSLKFLWGTLVPMCYLDVVWRMGFLHGRKRSLACICVYISSALAWTFTIWGAHGFLASMVSTSCFPLLYVCVYCAWNIVSIGKPKQRKE